MERFINIFNFLDKILLNILKFITITVFIFITLILTANVFLRFVPIASLHWSDEIVEMLFAALVFYGSAALWISKGHFSAGDWISKLLHSQRIKNLYRMILELIVLIFAGFFLFYSFNLFIRAMDVTNALAIPKKVLYSCMPISGFIMVLYSIKNVIFEFIGVLKPKSTEELSVKEK